MSRMIKFDIEDNGQLVSLEKEGVEYMHGGGKIVKGSLDKLGWQNSIIDMFPVVGSVEGNMVLVDGQKYPMNQHGIARALQQYVSRYDGGVIVASFTVPSRKVPNLKFDSSRPVSLENNMWQHWPFAAEIMNRYRLLEDSLLIESEITNVGVEGMFYDYGKHPALKTHGYIAYAHIDLNGSFARDLNGDRYEGNVSLEQIMKAPYNVLFIDGGADSLDFINDVGKIGMNMKSKGFKGNWMLWMPSGQNVMFCMEPVTRIPDGKVVNMNDGSHSFLMPDEVASYSLEMKPFQF